MVEFYNSGLKKRLLAHFEPRTINIMGNQQGQSDAQRGSETLDPSDLGNRAKEGLMVDFIEQMNVDEIPDKEGIIEAIYTFSQQI